MLVAVLFLSAAMVGMVLIIRWLIMDNQEHVATIRVLEKNLNKRTNESAWIREVLRENERLTNVKQPTATKQAPPPPKPQPELFNEPPREVVKRRHFKHWPQHRKQKLRDMIGVYCHEFQLGKKRPKGGLGRYMREAGLRAHDMKKFMVHNQICTEQEYYDLKRFGEFPPSLRSRVK